MNKFTDVIYYCPYDCMPDMPSLPLQSVTKTAMSAMSLLLSMSATKAISIDDPEKEGGGRRPIAFLVFRPMEDPVSSP